MGGSESNNSEVIITQSVNNAEHTATLEQKMEMENIFSILTIIIVTVIVVISVWKFCGRHSTQDDC